MADASGAWRGIVREPHDIPAPAAIAIAFDKARNAFAKLEGRR